jgi:hypothetical protein
MSCGYVCSITLNEHMQSDCAMKINVVLTM